MKPSGNFYTIEGESVDVNCTINTDTFNDYALREIEEMRLSVNNKTGSSIAGIAFYQTANTAGLSII